MRKLNNKLKKQLPNILTGLRFPLALTLLPMQALSPGFFIVYLLCGVTDVMDGALARRFNVCSDTGARLDSAADALLTAVLIVKLWSVTEINSLLIICVAGAALLRFAAVLTAKLKFGKFGFLHTYANKASGVLLMLYPFIIVFISARWPLAVLLTVAGASAAEELLIELTATSWNPDRISILQRSK